MTQIISCAANMAYECRDVVLCHGKLAPGYLHMVLSHTFVSKTEHLKHSDVLFFVVLVFLNVRLAGNSFVMRTRQQATSDNHKVTAVL